MCSFPAHNPSVPYLAYIPGNLQIGSRITIRGLMPFMADRFTIDLQCGGSSYLQDDIMLHLSVRPTECTIVRNTFECHSWGHEERFGSCPISCGDHYDINIHVKHDRYSITVNGRHYCEFEHRLPVSRVSHIHIAGETILHYVGSEGGHHVNHCPPVLGTPAEIYQPNIYPSYDQSPHHGHHHHHHDHDC